MSFKQHECQSKPKDIIIKPCCIELPLWDIHSDIQNELKLVLCCVQYCPYCGEKL
jgi:hypothetical protein